jgi:histidinol phosphatase-like PHP family hydrolase
MPFEGEKFEEMPTPPEEEKDEEEKIEEEIEEKPEKAEMEKEKTIKEEKGPVEIMEKWFEVLRGAGHVHTELSGETSTPGEARYSLEEIFSYLENTIGRGERRFFDYFIIADHPSSAEAPRSLTEEEEARFLEQKRKLDRLNEEHEIKGVAGVETSIISPDGKIDISNKLAAQLDLVIASMHGFPERDEKGHPIFNKEGRPVYKERTVEETAKLYEQAFLGTAENPNVDVIGHPTRYLSTEVLKAINWDKVFDALSKNGTAVEINLHDPIFPTRSVDIPRRENFKSNEGYEKALKNAKSKLEYNSELRRILRKAVKHKVKFFVGTDFHTLEQFWQPFRGFTSYEMGLMGKRSCQNLNLKEQEYYNREIEPRLNRLSQEERVMILKVAERKLEPSELKKVDQERLSKTPGPKFWIRYSQAILEMHKAGIKPEDVINTSREKLLKFCRTPKGQRIKS